MAGCVFSFLPLAPPLQHEDRATWEGGEREGGAVELSLGDSRCFPNGRRTSHGNITSNAEKKDAKSSPSNAAPPAIRKTEANKIPAQHKT